MPTDISQDGRIDYSDLIPVDNNDGRIDYSDLIPQEQNTAPVNMDERIDYSDLIPQPRTSISPEEKARQIQANKDIYAQEQAGAPVTFTSTRTGEVIPFKVTDTEKDSQGFMDMIGTNISRGNMAPVVSIGRALGTLTGNKDIESWAKQNEQMQVAEAESNSALIDNPESGFLKGTANAVLGVAGMAPALVQAMATTYLTGGLGGLGYWGLQGAGEIDKGLEEAGVEDKRIRVPVMLAGGVAYGALFQGVLGKIFHDKTPLVKDTVKELIISGLKSYSKKVALGSAMMGTASVITGASEQVGETLDGYFKDDPDFNKIDFVKLIKDGVTATVESVPVMALMGGVGVGTSAMGKARPKDAPKGREKPFWKPGWMKDTTAPRTPATEVTTEDKIHVDEDGSAVKVDAEGNKTPIVNEAGEPIGTPKKPIEVALRNAGVYSKEDIAQFKNNVTAKWDTLTDEQGKPLPELTPEALEQFIIDNRENLWYTKHLNKLSNNTGKEETFQEFVNRTKAPIENQAQIDVARQAYDAKHEKREWRLSDVIKDIVAKPELKEHIVKVYATERNKITDKYDDMNVLKLEKEYMALTTEAHANNGKLTPEKAKELEYVTEAIKVRGIIEPQMKQPDLPVGEEGKVPKSESKAPNYAYESPEAEIWWKEKERLDAVYDATEPHSAERKVAREARNAHEDTIQGTGNAFARVDLNNPTAQKLTVIGGLTGQEINLKGARAIGEPIKAENGLMVRQVQLANGKKVWIKASQPKAILDVIEGKATKTKTVPKSTPKVETKTDTEMAQEELPVNEQEAQIEPQGRIGETAQPELPKQAKEATKLPISKPTGEKVQGELPTQPSKENTVKSLQNTQEPPQPSAKVEEVAKTAPKVTEKPTAREPVHHVTPHQQKIDYIYAKMKKILPFLPEHVSVENASELPKDIQGKMSQEAGNIEAFYYNGKLYTIADNIKPERIFKVLLHEAVGHHGLANIFGEGITNELGKLYRSNKDFVRHVHEYAEKWNDIPEDITTEKWLADKTNEKAFNTSLEEGMVKFIENGEIGQSHPIIRTIRNVIAKALEAMGFKDEARALKASNVYLMLEGNRQLAGIANRALKSMTSEGKMGEGKLEDIKASRTEDKGMVDKLGFYSQVEKVISDNPQKANSKAGWLAWLKNQQGVKAEEMEWLGLEQLPEGKITKDKLLEFVRANDVRVEEKVKGDLESIQQQIRDLYKTIGEKTRNDSELRLLNDRVSKLTDLKYKAGEEGNRNDIIKYQEAIDNTEKQIVKVRSSLIAKETEQITKLENEKISDVKFQQYQLEGSKKNYRELLLTLPKAKAEFDTNVLRTLYPEKMKAIDEKYNTAKETKNEELEMEANRDLAKLIHAKEDKAGTFQSSHFDEPNILAHVRFNERTDAEGKKVLFVEEVQSDWHQAGREKGYANDKAVEPLSNEQWKEYQDLRNRYNRGEETTPEENKRLQELGDLYQASERARAGVPNAPFKTSWNMLTMKRMIRYATENGFDKIAWTTGAQQTGRYEQAFRKAVDRIEWRTIGGNKEVWAYKDGNVAFSAEIGADGIMHKSAVVDANGKHIDEAVGKNIAKQVQDSEKGEVQGKDLTIGGEGMKGFYDQILPSEVNKYVKKWGGRVGEIEITTRNLPDFVEGTKEEQTKVHSLELTPSMKQTVMEKGQMRFSKVDSPKPKSFDDEIRDMIKDLTNVPKSSAKRALPTVMERTANDSTVKNTIRENRAIQPLKDMYPKYITEGTIKNRPEISNDQTMMDARRKVEEIGDMNEAVDMSLNRDPSIEPRIRLVIISDAYNWLFNKATEMEDAKGNVAEKDKALHDEYIQTGLEYVNNLLLQGTESGQYAQGMDGIINSEISNRFTLLARVDRINKETAKSFVERNKPMVQAVEELISDDRNIANGTDKGKDVADKAMDKMMAFFAKKKQGGEKLKFSKVEEDNINKGVMNENVQGNQRNPRTVEEIRQTLARHIDNTDERRKHVFRVARVQRRRNLDNWLTSLNGRSEEDKSVWSNAKYSDKLEKNPLFQVIWEKASAMGLTAVPVTDLKGKGGMIDHATKTMYIAEKSPDEMAGFFAHETTHHLAFGKNEKVLDAISKVDRNSATFKEYESQLGYGGDKLAEELTAAIASGRDDIADGVGMPRETARAMQDEVLSSFETNKRKPLFSRTEEQEFPFAKDVFNLEQQTEQAKGKSFEEMEKERLEKARIAAEKGTPELPFDKGLKFSKASDTEASIVARAKELIEDADPDAVYKLINEFGETKPNRVRRILFNVMVEGAKKYGMDVNTDIDVHGAENAIASKVPPRKAKKLKNKEEFVDEAMTRINKAFKNRKIENVSQVQKALVAIGDKHFKGDISSDDIVKIFMEKMDIPHIDEATKEKLASTANDLSKFEPHTVEYKNMQAELYQEIGEAMKQGVNMDDIATNLFYQFILSRTSTQAVNLLNTGINVFADGILSTVSYNPKLMIQRVQSLYKLNEELFSRGASESVHHLKTGKNIIREMEKKFEKPNIGSGMFHRRFPKVAWMDNINYITRLMVGSDSFWYKSAASLKARYIAVEMANEAVKNKTIAPDKFWDYANEVIYASDTRLETARHQAEIEFKRAKDVIMKKRNRLTGKPTGEIYEGKDADKVRQQWIKRRVWEIQESARNSQGEGSFGRRVKDYALGSTFNGDPDGILGVISDGVGMTTNWKVPRDMNATAQTLAISGKLAEKSVIPFTRILANVMNVSMDYSGRGFISLPFPKTLSWGMNKESGWTKELTKDVKIHRLKRSIAGVGMLAGLYMLIIHNKKDDGTDDWNEGWDMYGSMADDPEGRKKLASMGGYPYSFRYGKTILPFTQLLPMASVFAVIGGVRDRQRVGKWKEGDWTGMFLPAFVSVAKTATSVSFLKNTHDFIGIWGGSTEETNRKLSTYAARTATIPIPALAKEVSGWFMDNKPERETFKDEIQAQFPAWQWTMKPALNYFGDPIKNQKFGYIMINAGQSLDYFTLARKKDMVLSKAGTPEVNGQKLDGEDSYEYGKKSGAYTKKLIDSIGFDTFKGLKDDKWSDKDRELLVDEEGNVIPSEKTTNRADMLMHQVLGLARQQAQYDFGEKTATQSEVRMKPEEFEKFINIYADFYKKNMYGDKEKSKFGFEEKIDIYNKNHPNKLIDKEDEKKRYQALLLDTKAQAMQEMWKMKNSEERKAYREWLKEIDAQAKIPRKPKK